MVAEPACSCQRNWHFPKPSLCDVWKPWSGRATDVALFERSRPYLQVIMWYLLLCRTSPDYHLLLHSISPLPSISVNTQPEFLASLTPTPCILVIMVSETQFIIGGVALILALPPAAFALWSFYQHPATSHGDLGMSPSRHLLRLLTISHRSWRQLTAASTAR